MENSKELYFEESGSENKATIVFLHGGGVGGWMWRKVVAILDQEYHCLVPDLPEQGRSADVAPFTVQFAADCVADLIRAHAHGGKAHVVGLSEGAQIVVSLLSRHPEVLDHAVVSSAILLPMPGQRMYTRGLFAASYRWFMLPFNTNDWWIRLNMHYSAGITDEYYPEFKRSFQEMTENGLVNLMYEAMHFTLPAGLEQAKLPVLVAAGAHEYKQMKDSARLLVKTLPHARGVLVSFGQGSTLAKEHNWAMTDPALFASTVRSWIEDKPLPEQLISFSSTNFAN